MDQRPIGGNAGLDLPPQSFDAAICRLGLMFFPDRQKALAAIRRALRPGARFAGVVWSGVEKNPAFGVTLAVVEPRLDPSEAPPPIRAIVSMGDPGLLEAALSQAGFHEVAVHAVATNRHAASTAEMVEGMRSGAINGTVNRLPESAREAAWREIAAEFARFQGPGGVDVPGEVLVAVGTN